MIKKRGTVMCVFCKIANHEIPSKIVYEDDKLLAFLDINPVTKGHTLIIPKKHFDNFSDCDSDLVKDIHEVSKILVKRYQAILNPNGFNLLSNMNAAAGQSVFHVHFHLIPRYDENDGIVLLFNHDESVQYTKGELTQLCQ
jgi:histidine triad (HIT) family protein